MMKRKRGLDGKEKALTWPRAAAAYLQAGKSSRFIEPLTRYWRDARVADMNAGSIRQSAINLYPNAKNSTRNRHVIVPTQAVINHCAELELCQHLKVKRFKVESEIKKPVTLDWVAAFRANATRPDIAGLAMFMFATGARISEALAIRWEDLDFKKRTALIRQTKIGNERIAHLPMELTVMLANLPRKGKSPFAFARVTSALGAWDATIKRAGIERLTFHCCRHGFATGLLRAGVDVITVAKLGGWKSAQHVFQTYGHASDDKTVTDRLFDTEERPLKQVERE